MAIGTRTNRTNRRGTSIGHTTRGRGWQKIVTSKFSSTRVAQAQARKSGESRALARAAQAQKRDESRASA